MKRPVDSFRDRFLNVVEQVQGFAIFVRGKEFQEGSIKTLEKLLSECTAHKDRAISEQTEDDANAYLAFEFMAKSLIEEFRFYLALKRDDPGAAWDHLINAQLAAAKAMKSHSEASHLEGYICRLHDLEHLLFPKPVFFSGTFIVRESECSICGAEFGECNHIRGYPYMGRLCARIIKKYDIPEVSPVSEPASKHNRVLSQTDENGIMRDFFTHRAINQGDDQHDNREEFDSVDAPANSSSSS